MFITHTRYGVPVGLSRKSRGKKEILPTHLGPTASPRIKQPSFPRTTRGPFRLSQRSLTRRAYPVPPPDPARGGEEERAEETLRPTVGAHPLSRTHRGIFLQNFSTEGSGFPPGKEISS